MVLERSMVRSKILSNVIITYTMLYIPNIHIHQRQIYTEPLLHPHNQSEIHMQSSEGRRTWLAHRPLPLIHKGVKSSIILCSDCWRRR